jgi:Holliday junction resolvasome RuvABC endonuclease subunit
MCILDGESVVFHDFSPTGKKMIRERQEFVVDSVHKMLFPYDILILEDFGVSSRFSPSGRFVERIEMCGMLKWACRDFSFPWLSAQPNLIKSFATGKSSAHKADVLSSVIEVWKVNPGNHDQADAFVLAAIGRAYFDDSWARGHVPAFLSRKPVLRRFEKYSDNAGCMNHILAKSNFYGIHLS